MPGVHVRKISQFDWFEQGQEPILTVPGSYWLCYKQKIYKFTFKYHRNVRDIGQFMYSKELLKVTRRIIKCSPAQGQQFGTRNLLVTYHHTSWTRQDKMFAMLKFRERANTKTINRAFILSVKICKSPLLITEKPVVPEITVLDNDQYLLNLKRKSTDDTKSSTKIKWRKTESVKSEKMFGSSSSENDTLMEDPDVTILDDDECKVVGIVQNKTQNTNMGSLSRNSLKKGNILDDRTAVRHKRRDKRKNNCSASSIDSNTSVDKSRRKLLRFHLPGDIDAKETSKSTSVERFEQNTDESSTSRSSDVAVVADKDKLKNPERRQLRHRNKSNSFVSSSIKEKGRLRGNINDELTPSSSSKSNKTSDNNMKVGHGSLHNRNNDADELTSDLPYQYFIEKEIENAKSVASSLLPSFSERRKNSQGRFISGWKRLRSLEQEYGESLYKQDLKNELLSQEGRKSKPNKDVVRKESDDTGLRSSNITDLVMEGLMLTIRQGQDSVSVVEQKTKLEVDEVLENSEKVETKEGEKCLVNSSLLKLENLITKIELSQMKDSNSVSDNNCSTGPESIRPTIKDIKNVEGSNIPTDQDHLKTIEFPLKPLNCYLSPKNDNVHKMLDTNSLLEESENNTSLNEESDLLATLKRGDEEFYTVPEILRQDLIVSNDAAESNSTKDKDALLMDYAGIDETEDDIRLSSQISLESFAQDNCTETVESQRPSVGPRVVSTEIVTLDQMPAILQKALENKTVKRYNPRQMVSEPSTSGGTLHEPLDKPEPSGNAESPNDKYNSMISNPTVENKLLLNSEYVCEHGTLFTVSKNASNNELEIHSDANYHANRPQEKTNSKTSPERNKQYGASGNKLQDITEDFFRDIQLQQQKATDQRCLRQRRRPTRTQNSIRNNDVQIEMLKFIQHITYGAKVVVQRLSTKNISAITRKNSSSLATCTN